jgi:dipeptidyl aminopeptidase/acylaminoacyl peptidase
VKRFLTLTITIIILFPSVVFANTNNTKAAFIREGNLFTLIGEQERQITNENRTVYNPKWSNDGKWILYQLEPTNEDQDDNEIWVYHIETKEKKRIARNGLAPEWAPDKNVVAYIDRGILDISDLEEFYNISTGVTDFVWFPEGNGFLMSSSGVARPDGWSSAILYTKEVDENYDDVVLFGDVDHFFTLPKEIGIGNAKVIAVNAVDFSFSPSSKWISFIVSPTASWAMDSNMICVIDRDGENFTVLDEVITTSVGEPKWAPTTDTLAFIAGGGRLVTGFKNKSLKLQEMPASVQYTPENYIDMEFDWITNNSIVTSRMEEREWSNDFSKHPLPTLYSISLKDNKQVAITNPPKGYGDYYPQYIRSLDKLVWLRGTSITDDERTLWKANPDGTMAEAWIENVDAIDFFPE